MELCSPTREQLLQGVLYGIIPNCGCASTQDLLVVGEGNRVVNSMASLAFNRALQLHVFAAPPNGILQ
ncbi:hypothetical protein Gotri_012969, partial [Gossypium trilobum]|nr:hypothetical protein [Gossypium trilobum]